MNLVRLAGWAPTLWRLGPSNLARMAAYRLAHKAGRLRRALPAGQAIAGPYFAAPEAVAPTRPTGAAESLEAEALALRAGRLRYFSTHTLDLGSPPDWLFDPFSQHRAAAPDRHWSAIGDFEPGAGDIKAIWELSRLEWALTLARSARAGQPADLALLEAWLGDWAATNPPNVGPNWKCGQEASLRLLHLLLSAHLLGTAHRPLPGLVALVVAHARRIAPSMGYAIAQDNNHGTSEAAALFSAGAWLATVAPGAAPEAARWEAVGRRRLEERVQRLVGSDGTFSQYSVTYHRMMLDTLAQAALWQRSLSRAPFSAAFIKRAAAATEWLHQLTDPSTGDAPNLGHNDGAYPFRLTGLPYRDFRPSLQAAGMLWLGHRLYPAGPWDEPAAWLGIEAGPEAAPAPRRSMTFPGGFVAIAQGETWGLVRAHHSRFRPPQADALHLDLWHRGVNVARDGGTFSYNAPAPRGVDLSGTPAHNTVTLDGRDQMPRLGRFLFGDWVSVEAKVPLRAIAGGWEWAGAYRDCQGGRHERHVRSTSEGWVVTDTVTGFQNDAVLRWRLAPGSWTLAGDTVSGPLGTVRVVADGPVTLALTEGVESRHYLEAESVPVLEARASRAPVTFITTWELV